jgi:hypothetical protein
MKSVRRSVEEGGPFFFIKDRVFFEKNVPYGVRFVIRGLKVLCRKARPDQKENYQKGNTLPVPHFLSVSK